MSYNNFIHTSKFEISIAKLYLLSLPFMMIIQFDFLIKIFGVTAQYLPFVFHIIGLFLWIVNERGIFKLERNNKILFIKTTRIVFVLNISSLLMAVVIQLRFGNYAGETAFSGIAGMIIYFFQFLLMFFYNIRIFDLLSKSNISNILHTTIRVLLVIAYLQVIVMSGYGSIIYDTINIFGNLRASNELTKLSLTGIEGATAGSIMGVLVFPFLFSKLMNYERKYLVELLLWILPLYFTNSTTAYLLFAVNLLLFLYYKLSDFKISTQSIRNSIILFSILLLIFSSLRITNVINDSVTRDINYLLFEKAIDKDNGSTASRTVPFYVNWGAFTEYPIFGVGNGLQGYFYTKYFPDWAFYVKGSDVEEFYYRSTNTISNGALFVPSLISGYGIVGFVLIVILSINFVRHVKSKKKYIGSFYYMFIFGASAFVVMGFQGGAYGLYFAWFVLSIPFMPKKT